MDFRLMTTTSRRQFLKQTSAGSLSLLVADRCQARPQRRPKVAAVFTSFHHRSHTHVILENFLEPYIFNGKRVEQPVDLVSFYADQFLSDDMAREVAGAYGIPLYGTIREALCLGGDQLAVDAVLSIAEHGNYPRNEFGQKEYPHKRFFDEIEAVIRESGRTVPVFNDKHLSHLWTEAKELYSQAEEIGIPLMAGSSAPLAQRQPALELPADCEFDDVVVIHGGPMESYSFHAFELLLSMIECRRGGESGVTRVEYLEGDQLREAAGAGRWSLELAKAAMAAEVGYPRSPLELIDDEVVRGNIGVLVTHRDGLQTTILRTAGLNPMRWNFACRLRGESQIRAMKWYVGPWKNRNLFKALAHAIQHHFLHGQSPYPVERTLLVSGMLDAAMKSKHRAEPVDTPDLDVHYPCRDFSAMREMGSSWQIITEDLAEPQGIDSADRWLPLGSG
ncbi:MAG: hypothetical protein CMJ81_01390 [Planctomycetaceae bacterium]|nr:hypothetical protein [Planctomycetaceae bacterium]